MAWVTSTPQSLNVVWFTVFELTVDTGVDTVYGPPSMQFQDWFICRDFLMIIFDRPIVARDQHRHQLTEVRVHGDPLAVQYAGRLLLC